jgi:hypothetical protein
LKVVARTNYIFDLDVEIGWDHDESDLEAFEKALGGSRVSNLRLDINQFKLASNTTTKYTHHDIILNILRNAKMKTVNIVLPLDFIGFSSSNPTPSTLQNLILNINYYFKGLDIHEYKALLETFESLPILKRNDIGS